MLQVLPKIFAYKLYKLTGFPRLLPMNYTFSLLYNCNSRCSTCRIWERQCKPLSVDEWEMVFRKLGHSPFWATLSGGEPFLRRDITAICRSLYRICRPKIINIPTNGILTGWIVEAVSEICQNCPGTKIVINVSLDGVGRKHDEIRNVRGNYDLAVDTFKKLKKLPYPNLSVGIHTVISRFNITDFSSISSQLMDLKPDSYITEIAERREELHNQDLDISPNQTAYKSAVDFLVHRIKHNTYRGLAKITQAFRIEYYNLVKNVLRDQTQPIPCYAGIASVQISPDGEVWSCCIKAKSLGFLRKSGYDLKKIWWTPALEAERRSIANKECYCPLANAAYTNMLLDIPTLKRVFYRSFIKWWI